MRDHVSIRRWSLFLLSLCGILLSGGRSLAVVSYPETAGKPVQIEISIFIIDIDAVNTVSQSFEANIYLNYRWKDSRLAHDGPGMIVKPLEEVWNPGLTIVNQQQYWPAFPEVVMISGNGEVTYRQRIWGHFSQSLNLKDFPFDRQTFSIQLATGGYSTNQVELVSSRVTNNGISGDLSFPDWDVIGWRAGPNVYKPIPDREGLPGYVFIFEAQRQQNYYVIKVIIPLILIVAMSWIVFWIDPKDSSTQIEVAVTSILTLIAYRFSVGVYLPIVSYRTRLDVFILGSTFLMFASLVEVMVTTTLVRRGGLKKAVSIDRWCRRVFPVMYMVVILLSFF